LSKLVHNQIASKRVTVSLDTEVYERLRTMGHFGESFSLVIARLLDELETRKGDKMKT
jgi:predicted CopG family antitoxin